MNILYWYMYMYVAYIHAHVKGNERGKASQHSREEMCPHVYTLYMRRSLGSVPKGHFLLPGFLFTVVTIYSNASTPIPAQ